MTQPEKELKILKRRLKEWEAEFFKTNGRKATIQDIANNPTIEGEYKKYRAEKKNLAGGSVSSKTDGTNKDTIRSKRKRPMTEENKNDPSTQQTISARSEGPETPFSGRRASYQFDSPRIQRYTSSTPTRRHSKVDTFVSSVHGNSPSHSRNNQNEPSNSQVSNLCRSPAHRRQKHSISPNQAAKRLLRTPTKLPSQSYTSPKALKSLETVFQESEIKGKPSLLDLFTQSAEKSPTIDAASPAAEPLALGGDESVQFFLEGMADTSFSTETPAGQSTQKHVPRRREKRPGLEGFAPSNSLDDAVTSSSKQPQNLKEPYSHSPSSSQSETQLLSPLSFKITRPSTGGIHNSVSPSTAKGEDIKNHIMPGFYSSLASTQNSRRLLISPDRRQRLLRQLSDHGGIGNVLMESPNNTQTTQDQLLQEDNLEEDNSPPEVWKKKPIQKRQTRRYKSTDTAMG
ncbi:hypothetical protein BGW37DRAFT_264390 [Umbelopsis sp. PMI_123]|nr:hypothetical protein BGW37DRAFT_264390 [Umbelopsis sp. PMI_123]